MNTIVKKIESTLTYNDVDFEKIINEMGQVSAAEKRSNGYEFSLNDHLRGFILSLLSNQRPWKQIANNLDNLEKIFFNYESDNLKNADPEVLSNEIKAIKCGNISIKRQMETLPYNISILEKISEKYGSIDNFITSKPVEEIAECLSNEKSPYKLKQLGMALTMEYLKNVGLSGMKPDTHLLRICGPERLNIIPETNSKEQLIVFERFSKEAGVSTTYLDNLIWIFGANEYGEICSSTPKCHKCELNEICNYPK
jgi:endonuclease III